MSWVRQLMAVLKLKVNRKSLPTGNLIKGRAATVMMPCPGDFPLGSPESRAAARAMLQRGTALSPYDVDCLTLYWCTTHLCGHAQPDSHWLERTPFYQRGVEIRDELYGPIIPSHLDPEYPRRTMASIYFEAFHNRLPVPGDILHYQDIANLYSEKEVKAEVEVIRGAWARRLPETPCPFRYEDSRMLIRQDDGSWQVDWNEDAATLWNEIEDDALERPLRFFQGAFSEPPTIRAVVFVESKDKKRRVKPLEPYTDLPRVESQAASPLVTP